MSNDNSVLEGEFVREKTEDQAKEAEKAGAIKIGEAVVAGVGATAGAGIGGSNWSFSGGYISSRSRWSGGIDRNRRGSNNGNFSGSRRNYWRDDCRFRRIRNL